MISELVYVHRVAGLLYCTADSDSFLPLIVIVFCRLITNSMTTPPVSHTKGGVTDTTKLVSLYGQHIFEIMYGLQAQFQAIKAELRQFCIIIFS